MASVETAGPAPLPAIHFHQLRAFLPREIAGLQAARDEGSTGLYGEVTISEAERSFVREDAELTFRIVDSSIGAKLAASIKDTLAQAQGADAAKAGLEPLDGLVGYVRYDHDEDQAEVNLLVGDRYVVAIVGQGFGGTDRVRHAMADIDFAALARLR